MTQFMLNYQRGWRLLFLSACLAGWCGCQFKSTPPGPHLVQGTAERGAYTLFHWKEGLVIMVCHDVVGHQESHGKGSTDAPSHQQWGMAYGSDGVMRFGWFAETTDGRTANFSITSQMPTPGGEGKVYDLSKGALFLVTTTGGKMVVQQLNRDLSAVQPAAESCKAFVAQDPDVSKLIGTVPR